MVVEGTHYFPRSSLREELVRESSTHTTCPWKGVASYLTVAADGAESQDAVWYYPTPKAGAEVVADRVAFWKDVRVTA